QVVHQLVATRVAFQRAVEFLGLLVQQVAGRVEGEGLDTLATGGLQQAAFGIAFETLFGVVVDWKRIRRSCSVCLGWPIWYWPSGICNGRRDKSV
ncbi:hypothetical protein RBE51_30065, partial [Pseudomonas taiwanensis]|uniref:hypothetical protein n=2 Tax=Pseudomonas TaxID=286 RepID=UPI0028DF8E10